MGGQSRVNRDAERSQRQAEAERRRAYTQAQQPSQAETRFNRQASEWENWIRGKNYGTPPPDSFLNFDLYSQGHEQAQREKYSDLQGVGAANFGAGTGKNQAASLARERNINEASQRNAAGYEQAVGEQDAYFKGSALPYAQMQQARNMGLLGNSSQMTQYYGDLRARTQRPGLFGQIFGGIMGAAGGLLGNPGLFGGR